MLRAAGFESYAAMTMAGSRIDYIPADQFNHSVAAVKLSDGSMQMLDPTWVPFVRELWSSAEQQQNYIIGLPEGQDLQETPISAPENHYMKIAISSTLLPNGDLECEMNVKAEGQTDAAFRRSFTGANKKYWNANFRNLLLSQFPSATISECSYAPENIIQVLDGAIELNYSFKIPAYAIVSKEEVVFVPMAFNKLFPAQQRQLAINTSIKERKYPFRESCSRLVKIEETLKLSSPLEIAYQANPAKVEGSGASWNKSLRLEGNILKISQIARFNKRIYQPEDWASYRAAVLAQNKVALEPIVLKKK
jgi:hypothetical protein